MSEEQTPAQPIQKETVHEQVKDERTKVEIEELKKRLECLEHDVVVLKRRSKAIGGKRL